MAGPEDYLRHSRMTDPGRHREALRAVADRSVADLVKLVQGLLVHGEHLDLYGLTSTDVADMSRATLPVAERLDQLATRDGQPSLTPRLPKQRAVGTCRDFALMTCALLRVAEIPARVRCGFATYFAPGRYEDHWVSEYWREDDQAWHFADAQLDAEHRTAFGIEFAPQDLPRGAFVNAAQAWQMVRTGERRPENFGHGESSGEWFLRVNLARDLLTLDNRETSSWDGWRSLTDETRGALSREDDEWRRTADAILLADVAPERLVAQKSSMDCHWAPLHIERTALQATVASS